jgi:cytochrome c553
MKFLLIATGVASLLVSCAVVAEMPWISIGRWRMRHHWSEIERLPRHQAVKATGVPEPYASMRNPLLVSRATIASGADVYAKDCVSCHGTTGEGDGPAGRRLSPRPGDLVDL